jgi:thiamine-phosphate pyrophosphorylase
MNYTLSHGLERALCEAARWRRSDDAEPLGLPEALLGLALESECRAAQWLSRHGITPDDVRSRWPELQLAQRRFEMVPYCLSSALREVIRAAQQRLAELPQPLALATEHLLLGMLIVPSEVAEWLGEQGFSAAELEREIHAQYGLSPGPIEVEGIADRGLGKNAECGMRSAEFEAGALRILDAAANRAREAVRVLEDYVRFVLDDRHLTERCKHLRHELAALLSTLPTGWLLAARETQSDVGTTLSVPSEQRRENLGDVVTANAKRLQESLRTLEEYGKTISPALGQGLEQLRYQSYTLERAVAVTANSIERLQHARLYVLIDGGNSLAAFEALAESLVAAGVGVLQLRDKQLDDRTLLDRARLLRAITRRSRTLLVINDRPDLAALCQADGVHVGQEELSVKDARSIVGAERLVGVSTHSIQQARQAALDGADYIGVGPTFPSSTKQFQQFTGAELLSAVAQEIRLPAFAIGGVTLDNLSQVLATGIGRVAISGAIAKADDPASSARAFLQRLNGEP